jgi:predicted MFS family arabinose efflux permease
LRAAYPPPLRWLTAMSFSALLLEGVLTNWIALLVTGAGSSPATGSLCLTAFAAALLLGRLGYSATASRVNRVLFVRTMGLLVILGIAGLVTFPTHLAITVTGAAAAGLGLANLHPFCTAAVGHAADATDEENALGRMNRIAYIGIALESLLIAGLTALLGLKAAIALVGLLAITFIAQARLFDSTTQPQTTPS